MKLAKTYALQIGVKMDKPYITEHFYPLPLGYEKYIIIHASAGGGNTPGKVYDHYDEVIKLLEPILSKSGYKMIQIGGPNEPIVGKDVLNLCGVTSFQQTAFLIKNCSLFIGNDSMNSHMAGAYQVPMVTIYGPTDVKNHGPNWYDESKSIFLESHRFGEKHPSYNSRENKKTINLIKPEDIVNASLKLLGIEEINRNSVFFGPIYKAQIIELIPNNMIRPDFLPEVAVNIRMDYFHNEEILVQMLQTRKCGVFISKPIDIRIFEAFRKNLAFIKVKMTDSITADFAKKLINLGCPVSFATDSTDLVWINKKRLEFMDCNIMIQQQISDTKEQFYTGADEFLNKKFDREEKLSEYSYKSTKFLVSSDGIFTSKAAWLKKRPIENFMLNSLKIADLEDDPEFWKELQHLYIFK